MNTDNQTAPQLERLPQALPDIHPPPPASPDPPLQPPDQGEIPIRQASPPSAWRHNGKVARLPKTLRDKINLMIQDGVTFPDIIKNLGEPGQDLNVMNLSRWKDSGYSDWLAEQAFIARTRARQETPGELVRDFDATEVSHAALQLGTLHVFEALRDLAPGALDDKLGGDCSSFARLLNALARASRETIHLQKYREACARARTALQDLKDPKRKLSESETRAIVMKVDDLLGLTPRTT